MNYSILLLDEINMKIEPIENFKGTEHELKQHLFELQEGYCQDEKPKVVKRTFKDENGNHIQCFCAFSESDYSYISPLKII